MRQREIGENETVRMTIWCPMHGWEKVVEMEGPVSELDPDYSLARYFAEEDITRHCGERDVFQDEYCTPFLISESGPPQRYEQSTNSFHA